MSPGPGRLIGQLAVLALVGGCASGEVRLPVDDLVEAPRFEVNVFAIVPGAGSLVAAPGGAVYVATEAGSIARLEDLDGDGVADRAVRLETVLEPPISLALDDGGQVVAMARDRVVRLKPEPSDVVVPPGVLPAPRADDRHYLQRGPDGRLYVALGRPCRGCRGHGLAGSIIDMRPDGHDLQVRARATRRPSAFDWHPATEQMIVAAVAPGPVARERDIRGLFGLDIRPAAMPGGVARGAGDDEVVPELAWTFEEGLVPTALDFYAGDGFPSRLQNALLVILNPADDEPDGAPSKVVAVPFDAAGRPRGEEVLLTGWRGQDGTTWGRPIDLEDLADGSVLISDERAGVVYRLTYQPED